MKSFRELEGVKISEPQVVAIFFFFEYFMRLASHSIALIRLFYTFAGRFLPFLRLQFLLWD